MDENRHLFIESLRVEIASPNSKSLYSDCFALISNRIALNNQNARNVYSNSATGDAVWINGHAEANINTSGSVNFLQGEQLVICQDPNAEIDATDIVVCSCKDKFCSTTDATNFKNSPANNCPNPLYY
jgi:hypothetical protein